MIEYILGIIFGLSVLLFIRITIVTRKLDKLIRDIDDTQNWIRKIQIDIWILINNGKLKEIEIEID
jgi:hypothetical protein